MNKKLLSVIMAAAMVGSQAVVFAETETAEGTVIINEPFSEGFGNFQESMLKNETLEFDANVSHSDDGTGSAKLCTYTTDKITSWSGKYYGAYVESIEIDSLIPENTVKAGKKYHFSAFVKYGRLSNQRLRASMAVVKDTGWSVNDRIIEKTEKRVQMKDSEWTEIAFDWEPTKDYEKCYLKIWLNSDWANDPGNRWFTSGTKDEDKYDYWYVDDISMTELKDEVFELVSTYPTTRATLYNNEAYEIECSTAPSAETSAITVTDSNGNAAEAALSVTDKTLNINIQNRVQGEAYTISGTVKALNGQEFTIEPATFTADNETHMNETFDGSLDRFTNRLNAAELTYDPDESRTADGTGAAKLYYSKVNDSVKSGFQAMVGTEKKLSSAIEAGKEYVVSAWVKAKKQAGNQGMKLTIASDLSNQVIIKNTEQIKYETIKLTDEWQKISMSWIPTEDQAKAANAGKYYIRVQRTNYTEMGANDETNVGDIFYIDDISITESANLTCDEITLTDGQLFYAWDNGYSAVFSLPVDLEKSDITVKDSDGNDVAIDKTTNITTVNIVIPSTSRKHNAEYTAHFGTIYSTSGKVLEMNKDIKFTTNTEFRYSENFDGGLGDFSQDKTVNITGNPAVVEYDSAVSRLDDNSGSAKLTVEKSTNWAQNVGFERKIVEKQIISGDEYLISAWVKAGIDSAVGDTLQLDICSGLTEISQILSPVQAEYVSVSEDWKEVTMLWTPTAEQAQAVKNGTMYLRIAGFKNQGVGDIYYIDDVSIKAVESNKAVTFNGFKATTTSDGKVTTIETAKELKGNTVSASCVINNQKAVPQNYIVCFAAFDTATNKLIAVTGEKGTLSARESKTIAPEAALDLTNAENNCTIKVFIWDGLINQSPLSEVKIPLN